MPTETYASALPPQHGPGVVESTTVLSGGGHAHRRVSWGAIFGGVILVVAVQLLLSLLGAGIGLGTVNVTAGSTPSGDSLGIGRRTLVGDQQLYRARLCVDTSPRG